jgi:hypothetical protein
MSLKIDANDSEIAQLLSSLTSQQKGRLQQLMATTELEHHAAYELLKQCD